MNPWTGVNCWREFCYDARHPLLFVRRGWEGVKATVRWMFNVQA